MARQAKVAKEKIGVSLDEVEAGNALKKSREGKRNEALTEDLMYGKRSYERTIHSTMEERDRKHAILHDFGHNERVEMVWDLNQDGIRDQVFMLKVGSSEVIISAVELQKYLRWV